MSEEEAGSVEEQLLLACQNGDAGTLQTITSSVPGLDLSMATEDGVTLLMQTIIGAGECLVQPVANESFTRHTHTVEENPFSLS